MNIAHKFLKHLENDSGNQARYIIHLLLEDFATNKTTERFDSDNFLRKYEFSDGSRCSVKIDSTGFTRFFFADINHDHIGYSCGYETEINANLWRFCRPQRRLNKRS